MKSSCIRRHQGTERLDKSQRLPTFSCAIRMIRTVSSSFSATRSCRRTCLHQGPADPSREAGYNFGLLTECSECFESERWKHHHSRNDRESWSRESQSPTHPFFLTIRSWMRLSHPRPWLHPNCPGGSPCPVSHQQIWYNLQQASQLLEVAVTTHLCSTTMLTMKLNS